MDTLTYSAMAVIASDNEDRNTVTMFSKKISENEIDFQILVHSFC